MGNNRHILQWKDYIEKALESLSNNNFDEYEDFMKKADDMYRLYREDSKLTYECVNFGMANYIFEDALPYLFKTNKKIVKEFINTIKSDSNLLNQFKFQQALRNVNENIDAHAYVSSALELVKNDINVKTLKESNKKLFNLIKENNIRPTKQIDESILSYFESCDYLLNNKCKLSNLSKINENINNVVNYVKTQTTINESKENLFNIIEEFEKKYNNVLTEEEKSFVKEIIDDKSTNVLEKKEQLFNKFKNECITIINTLLESSDNDDSEGLNEIKYQIENKVFCESTLVTDIAKLLEIRDILNS